MCMYMQERVSGAEEGTACACVCKNVYVQESRGGRCMCMYMQEHVSGAEEGTERPTEGVLGGCEPPSLSAGSQTQSLCKSSNALNH